jgi:hypothetical protein
MADDDGPRDPNSGTRGVAQVMTRRGELVTRVGRARWHGEDEARGRASSLSSRPETAGAPAPAWGPSLSRAPHPEGTPA